MKAEVGSGGDNQRGPNVDEIFVVFDGQAWIATWATLRENADYALRRYPGGKVVRFVPETSEQEGR